MSGNRDRLLSKQELPVLQRRSDLKGWERLAIHAGLLSAAGWFVAVSSGWMVLPPMFVLGVVRVALFAPAFETMHQTAFASLRANACHRRLADVLSTTAEEAFLYRVSFGSPPAHARPRVGSGNDGGDAGLSALVCFAVLGVPFWTLRLKVVWDCWRGDLGAYPFVSVAAAPKIVRSVRAMTLLVAGGAAATGLVFGWATPLLYWIDPQLLGQPPLRAYLLVEYTGCTEDRNGLTNTRTTLTCAPARLLMWDMPYHAEHHLFPSIPFHRLVDAHVLIRAKLGVLQRGYVHWNAGFLQSLIGRSSSPQTGPCQQ